MADTGADKHPWKSAAATFGSWKRREAHTEKTNNRNKCSV